MAKKRKQRRIKDRTNDEIRADIAQCERIHNINCAYYSYLTKALEKRTGFLAEIGKLVE